MEDKKALNIITFNIQPNIAGLHSMTSASMEGFGSKVTTSLKKIKKQFTHAYRSI